jgi:hypothetical protein
MEIPNNLLYYIIFFSHSLLYCQVDTVATEKLQEVIIVNKKTVKLKKNRGIYEVNVQGTSFEDQQDTWEALKKHSTSSSCGR